jgi:hypothetical protein
MASLFPHLKMVCLDLKSDLTGTAYKQMFGYTGNSLTNTEVLHCFLISYLHSLG